MDKNLIIKILKFILYFLLAIFFLALVTTGYLDKIITFIRSKNEGALGSILILLIITIPVGTLLNLMYNVLFDVFPSTKKAMRDFRWNDRE